MPKPLTDTEQAVLALAARRWKCPGAKEEAMLTELGMTPTRYYQVLESLIDRPEAREAEPQLVRRLQRLRDQRRPARSPRL